MRQLRGWIQGAVIAGSLLLVLSLFAGGIWGVLCALGDEFGAEFAKGAALVVTVSFLITHILLVTLLALAVLQTNMEREQLPSSGPAADH